MGDENTGGTDDSDDTAGAGGGESGVGAEASGAAPRVPAGTESALLRAKMLALGLSRSATSTQST